MHVGLMGYARSGKDTAGEYLTREHGYRRVSFADPLREAAWEIDPYISVNAWPEFARRLSDKVAGPNSWERVKDEYPEVRRFLQTLGQSIRNLDEDFWVRQALKRVDEVEALALPAVVTDVRYPNEVTALRRRGFHLIYVDRPGTGPVNGHVSESAVSSTDADETVSNDGTVADFYTRVEVAWQRIYDRNSRRHYGRSYE
ncbi:hypothetical protein [Streptomyces scopuliridis]|uniref:deoxynucleotide monophosphate kinase family protein n=1 Tax=Streptomyces scopuliridis TaxID=452529 RepID=UPI003673671C